MKGIGEPVTLADGSVVPLSRAIATGGYLYVSGQLGIDPFGMFPSDIGAQTEQCLRNIDTVLRQAGSSLSRVVKVTAWLTCSEDFAVFNKVYEKSFQKPYPARSTVCAGLLLPEALVEIEVIAEL